MSKKISAVERKGISTPKTVARARTLVNPPNFAQAASNSQGLGAIDSALDAAALGQDALQQMSTLLEIIEHSLLELKPHLGDGLITPIVHLVTIGASHCRDASTMVAAEIANAERGAA